LVITSAGRLFGVKADVFSIGFGSELFGITDKRGTRWKFSVLPLGGYVRFAGDMNAASQPDADWLLLPPEQRAQTFPSKPVWQRAIIVAAGPVMNFIIAILILARFALRSWCQRNPGDHRVDSTWQRGGAGWPCAERSHRRTGRRSIENFADMADFTLMRPGEKIIIDYLHGNTPVQREITIGTVVEHDRFGGEVRIGRLGIGPGHPYCANQHHRSTVQAVR